MEAATRSVSELSRLTPLAKLQQTPVKEKMLRIDSGVPRAQNPVFFLTDSPADRALTLQQVVTDLERANKGDRIPIIDTNNRPLGVIHKSIITDYLRLHPDQPGPPRVQATLNDLLSAPEIKTSFGTVAEDDNLGTAKAVMEATNQLGGWGCQDVFVTPTGKRTEGVLGWITNVIIEQNSTV